MSTHSTLRVSSTLPALALALVLAGCSSASSEPTPVPTVTVTTTVTATATVTATPRPATSTPRPATPMPAPTSTAAAPVSGIPSPNASQEALLLAYMAEVDLALVGEDEKVVRRARNQCSSILGGATEESLISTTRERFEQAPDFYPSVADAEQILAGIRASGFCVEG